MMIIRSETATDAGAIGQLIDDAFRDVAYASGTEAAIVRALRAAGALSLSRVAVEDDRIIGQIAFSPVTINGADLGWYGLGPVAVRPDCQGRAVGAELIRDGLDHMRGRGAEGIVLLGNPAYYGRFGFEAVPELRLPDVPPEYFLTLAFKDKIPSGIVAFHPAFDVSA
jgi:putative acetyltransferase